MYSWTRPGLSLGGTPKGFHMKIVEAEFPTVINKRAERGLEVMS